MPSLTGQAAIITGGAQGIGLAVATRLAASGANVLIADLQQEKADAAADAITKAHQVRARAIATNITSAGDCDAMAKACVDQYGRIDILVNVAGGAISLGKREHLPLEEVPEADFKQVVELNLHGSYLTAKAVVPTMKQRHYGRIVFISSVAGRTRSRSGIHAYAAGKAGALGLMRDLAHELGEFGITVNSVAPGFIASNPRAVNVWETMDSDRKTAYLEELSVKRLGKPEEIAAAVEYFVSPDAGYTSGQTLIVDGGKVTY